MIPKDMKIDLHSVRRRLERSEESLSPYATRSVDAVRDTINHAVNCVDDFLKGKKPSTVINHEIYAD